MINEEDFTVASLAKLVGSELNTIDMYTSEHGSTPANKLDPKSFITKRNLQKPNSSVVKHQGMMFHAGVDETLVQQLYPDPKPSPPVDTPSVERFADTPAIKSDIKSLPQNFINEFVKILQSIDKTLKAIDKNEKATIKILNHLTNISSDKNTN